MKEYRVAVWFASILLSLGATTGQQTSATPESQASQPASNSESESAPCQPQRPTATTPFDVCEYWPVHGPGIHAPRAESAPDPTYPEAARKAKLNGSVVVALAINAQGGVDDVKVVRSSDRRFEQSAMDAAKQWKFAPATKDGEPVAVQINAEMNFRLR
jgi:TonB family protein